MKTKKALKSIIALALALILSLGVVSTAFAANVGDTIEWTYEGDYGEYTGVDTYTYKGELGVGPNILSEENLADICFTFDCEKAGFYIFRSSDKLNYNVSEEIRNGAPHGYADCLYGYFSADEEDDYDCYKIFYIPEGTVYTAVYAYSEYIPQDTIRIEYLGAELTDVSLDENALKDLIKGYDFGYGSGKGFDFRTDVTLTFDNEYEKTLEGAYIRLDTLDGSEVVEGENTVKTINTFGVEKEYTLTCYPITHYVQKVEITNLDKYLTCKRFYREGMFDSFGFYTDNGGKGIAGETLTVTLSDGSTQSFVLDWDEEIVVKLPNGREVNVYMGENYRPYEDKAYFVVMICGEFVLEKECTETEATAKENLDLLKRRIGNKISSLKNWMNLYMHWLGESESVIEALRNVGAIFDVVSSKAAEIFSEIRDCCEHLILG